MVRNETREGAGTGRSSRALVETGTRAARETGHRVVGGRPTADFLTQLIVGADPSLRASRLDRTRIAAALYAEASGRCR